jgi:hypothetical protein
MCHIGGITLQWWHEILLWQRGRILSGQGSILLQWGIGCRGFSVCILVAGASKHVLHPPQSVLEYGYHVLCFDYDNGWWRCTDGRGNSEDSGDVGLCNLMHRSSIQVVALKSSWLPLNGLIKGLLLFKSPCRLVQQQKHIVV